MGIGIPAYGNWNSRLWELNPKIPYSAGFPVWELEFPLMGIGIPNMGIGIPTYGNWYSQI